MRQMCRLLIAARNRQLLGPQSLGARQGSCSSRRAVLIQLKHGEAKRASLRRVADTWELDIFGAQGPALTLSLDELRRLPHTLHEASEQERGVLQQAWTSAGSATTEPKRAKAEAD